VEEPGVSGESHRPVASHWQTLSHNVVSNTFRHERGSNSQLLVGFTAFGYSVGILSFCWITIHLKKNVYNNSIKVNIWNATIRKHLNTMIIISHDSITWFTIQLHVIQTKTTYFGHQIWHFSLGVSWSNKSLRYQRSNQKP
jgi:hypothetical protein